MQAPTSATRRVIDVLGWGAVFTFVTAHGTIA
jgi:hypothetical protein